MLRINGTRCRYSALPIGYVIAISTRHSAGKREAMAVRHKRPVVHAAGNILRMRAITVSDPVNTNVITRPELISIARHTNLQPLADIAQPAGIAIEDLDADLYWAIDRGSIFSPPQEGFDTAVMFHKERLIIGLMTAIMTLKDDNNAFIERFQPRVKRILNRVFEYRYVDVPEEQAFAKESIRRAVVEYNHPLVVGLLEGLGLTEPLIEAVCLGHDLGHAPFGHAGEEALENLLKRHGLKWNSNVYSLIVVEEVEEQYCQHRGLNLTWAVREGLALHKTRFDMPVELDEYNYYKQCSLESQAANIADIIAYSTHDVEDALEARLVEIDDLCRLKIGFWDTCYKKALNEF